MGLIRYPWPTIAVSLLFAANVSVWQCNQTIPWLRPAQHSLTPATLLMNVKLPQFSVRGCKPYATGAGVGEGHAISKLGRACSSRLSSSLNRPRSSAGCWQDAAKANRKAHGQSLPECAGCGEHFSSLRSFDRHRIGDHGLSRRCLTVAELHAQGWPQGARGLWLESRRKHAPADISACRTGSAMATWHADTRARESLKIEPST